MSSKLFFLHPYILFFLFRPFCVNFVHLYSPFSPRKSSAWNVYLEAINWPFVIWKNFNIWPFQVRWFNLLNFSIALEVLHIYSAQLRWYNSHAKVFLRRFSLWMRESRMSNVEYETDCRHFSSYYVTFD